MRRSGAGKEALVNSIDGGFADGVDPCECHCDDGGAGRSDAEGPRRWEILLYFEGVHAEDGGDGGDGDENECENGQVLGSGRLSGGFLGLLNCQHALEGVANFLKLFGPAGDRLCD